MNEVLGGNPTFEYYDEDEIQSLLSQGWQMDADGLDEDEAYEMSQFMTQENRVFIKEDGTCTILVKQMSAVEEMGGFEYGENPQDLREEMHGRYEDTLPEVIGGESRNR